MCNISFIVPVYNIENYIEECLESICTQDYLNYEIIVVDDGSTDNSAAKILNIQNRHADISIKYIKQENQGLSQARNTGIKNAVGKYLWFIDGDDFIDNRNILINTSKLLVDEVDLLVMPMMRVSDIDKIVHPSLVRYNMEWDKKRMNEIFKPMLQSGRILSSASEMIIRREFIEQNKLYFKPGIFSEDIEWLIRLMSINPKIRFTNEQAYCYRWNRNGSICNSKTDLKKVLPILDYIQENYLRLKDKNDKMSYYLLNYLAYFYCVAISRLFSLEKEEEQYLYLLRLKEIKGILKYDLMPKVKIFKYVSMLFGIKITGKLGRIKYLFKRRKLL